MCWLEDDRGFIPTELEDVADKLFSLDNVYVATTPCDDYFDKDGSYIGEFGTRTCRSTNPYNIINEVKHYLDLGCDVFVYVYYGLNQVYMTDVNEFKKIKEYWYRIIIKKII